MNKRLRKLNWFYVPAICIVSFFIVVPFFRAFYISLCQWNGYSKRIIFVGLKNYLEMFSDAKLGTAFVNTIIYGFGSTLLQNVLGMAMAFFINGRFKGSGALRVIIYLPIMISNFIMGYIMYYLVSYNGGVFNEILSWFGFEPIDWMGERTRAVIIILLINTWQYLGNSMVIYLSGIQNIPKMYDEAARIEGASVMQRFRYVTLPLLSPAISSAVITNLIGGLNLYGVIASLTGGGPLYATHSVITYLNNRYFQGERAGYASAIGITLFGFIMLVTLIGNAYFDKKKVEM